MPSARFPPAESPPTSTEEGDRDESERMYRRASTACRS